MDGTLSAIAWERLLIAFVPSLLLLVLLRRWTRSARVALVANGRMLVQLLLVGYALTYVFATNEPLVVGAVIVLMILAASWIALRPLGLERRRLYPKALLAISVSGLAILAIVTQGVLDLPRWFEPHVVVPLAGMIFANSMNTLSLASERFASECERNEPFETARGTAFQASLIPQINGLLAVGLVSLPGMMTGQILSGIDPLVAVRYQIMVMCMLFAAGGFSAALYLQLRAAKP